MALCSCSRFSTKPCIDASWPSSTSSFPRPPAVPSPPPIALLPPCCHQPAPTSPSRLGYSPVSSQSTASRWQSPGQHLPQVLRWHPSFQPQLQSSIHLHQLQPPALATTLRPPAPAPIIIATSNCLSTCTDFTNHQYQLRSSILRDTEAPIPVSTCTTSNPSSTCTSSSHQH